MQIELTEDEAKTLEAVRQKLNLSSLDEAAEFLFRTQLKKATKDFSAGRGLSLYVVKK